MSLRRGLFLAWAAGASLALLACEEARLRLKLGVVPVNPQGQQVYPDPPATVADPAASAADPAASPSLLPGGVLPGGTPRPTNTPPSPTPQPSPTAAPVDLEGCAALEASERVPLRGAPVIGPGAPWLGPAGTTGAVAEGDLLGRVYEVTCPGGAGVVAIQLQVGGVYRVFFDEVVNATLSDLNGQVRQLRGQRPLAPCGKLVSHVLLGLPTTKVFLRITGADRVGLAFGVVQD